VPRAKVLRALKELDTVEDAQQPKPKRKPRQNRVIDPRNPPLELTPAEAERLSGWSHNRMQDAIETIPELSEKRGSRRWIFRDILFAHIKKLSARK
jgi:hypothetical protein